jgi:hypothetical protein
MFIENNNSEYKETIYEQFEMSLYQVVRDIGHNKIFPKLFNNNDFYNFQNTFFLNDSTIDFYVIDSPNIYFDEMF